jgi:hypothetical protein
MSLMVSNEAKPRHTFDPAEMGAIAHLCVPKTLSGFIER